MNRTWKYENVLSPVRKLLLNFLHEYMYIDSMSSFFCKIQISLIWLLRFFLKFFKFMLTHDDSTLNSFAILIGPASHRPWLHDFVLPAFLKNKKKVTYSRKWKKYDRIIKDRVTLHPSDFKRNKESCSEAEHVIEMDHQIDFEGMKILDVQRS